MAINSLHSMLHKRKVTVKELQSLCGYLNFIGKAIFARRNFTRRMYSKFSGIIKAPQDYRSRFSYQLKLKQHHHICLDEEFKLDCQVWLHFLTGEVANVVNRPMVDLLGKMNTSRDIQFTSDASGSIGFGVTFGKCWIRGDWSKQFLAMCC